MAWYDMERKGKVSYDKDELRSMIMICDVIRCNRVNHWTLRWDRIYKETECGVLYGIGIRYYCTVERTSRTYDTTLNGQQTAFSYYMIFKDLYQGEIARHRITERSKNDHIFVLTKILQ